MKVEEEESYWQKCWQDSGIFTPGIDPSRKKFFITVPFPYANGALHVGHGRTYTLADIIARYKRTQGYNVLFPMAFHLSGSPILAFASRIKAGDRATIELYRDYLREYVRSEKELEQTLSTFSEPMNIASYFSKRIRTDFERLGFSIDWTREFTSIDPVYQDFVRWQFVKLRERGLIKNGSYPILYSKEDDNPVGEDDIRDGDTDKVTIEEFTALKFRGEKHTLLAASVRPETIFGITNLWVSNQECYVECMMGGDKFVLSESGYEKLKLQKEHVENLGRVSVSDLLNDHYSVPVTGKKVMAYRTDFVNPQNATGVVYSVPGHAVWDYIAIKQGNIDLNPISIIEFGSRESITVEGLVSRYSITSTDDRNSLDEATKVLYKEEFYNGWMSSTCGAYAGLSVRDARERIRADLDGEGLGFTFYETSRMAETRGGSRVLVAVLKDQWFIDYSPKDLKARSHEIISAMTIYPEYYRSALNEAIDWLKERPCARRRTIGTKLPFDENWIIESLSDSTLYPAVYTNYRQLKELHDRLGHIPAEVLDYIFRGESSEKMGPLPEDLKKIGKEARENLEYWYGVDIRLTAYPHISNHLSFYIMNHAAILEEKFSPRGIVIDGLVTSNGSKISKSKGNVVTLLGVVRNNSADLYRLYVALVADLASTMDWNNDDLSSIRKKLDLFNAIMESFKPEESNPVGAIHGWFYAKFMLHASQYIEKMNSFDIRSAFIQIFYEVLNDLKYVERRNGSRNASISGVLRPWLIMLSPVIPHTAEKLWSRYVAKSLVSGEMLEKDFVLSLGQRLIAAYGKSLDKFVPNWRELSEEPLKLASTIVEAEDYLNQLISDVREIIRTIRITPSSVEIFTSGQESRMISELILANRPDEIEPHLKPYIGEGMKLRKSISIKPFSELEVLLANREYLESVFNIKVYVNEGPLSVGGKNAWPGRPKITIR
ncbi:MAG: leucine--tRNA ligase [Candidatus Thermoplasmatota archaeon]|nr:leucine--tRNA ligase [Candidatus Thermoplasmatota archaeon]